MAEYEKQRLLRIRENKARLEALGLPGLASSLRNDLSKQAQEQARSASTVSNTRRTKKKKIETDEEEEYQPSDDDDEEEEEEEEEDELMEDRPGEEEMPSSSSSSSRRKGKSSISSNELKPSKVSRLKRGRKDDDFVDDDVALAQAIALSLGESVENANDGVEKQNKAGQMRKSNSTIEEESLCKKINKKPSKSRIQLSEDEVIGFFFSFDEVGKGYITAYDIEKTAIAHDFTWTDGEIAKMVRSFDSDGDRKLSLEDFRSIVSRCHMLQEPQ